MALTLVRCPRCPRWRRRLRIPELRWLPGTFSRLINIFPAPLCGRGWCGGKPQTATRTTGQVFPRAGPQHAQLPYSSLRIRTSGHNRSADDLTPLWYQPIHSARPEWWEMRVTVRPQRKSWRGLTRSQLPSSPTIVLQGQKTHWAEWLGRAAPGTPTIYRLA